MTEVPAAPADYDPSPQSQLTARTFQSSHKNLVKFLQELSEETAVSWLGDGRLAPRVTSSFISFFPSSRSLLAVRPPGGFLSVLRVPSRLSRAPAPLASDPRAATRWPSSPVPRSPFP